tara:strand:- start:10353 stop:11090 length:738 start_codon:yes stop_codon:yes gene_type:complete
MIKDKKILGIVLARSGSKGLPGKNYKLLDGKPLVQYAIEAGTESKYIDNVIVSSDCSKCIDIAKNLGVDAPFIRPKFLSGDEVYSADVIEHAITYLNNKGDKYDLFVLLEPTSPLRDASDVDSALEIIIEKNATALVSVCLAEDQHPNFMFKEMENNRLTTWSGEEFKQFRRQDIDQAYFLDGSVYISDVELFLSLRTFCHKDTVAYIVPKWKSFEVDDMCDFLCIEAIMNYRSNFPRSLNDKEK